MKTVRNHQKETKLKSTEKCGRRGTMRALLSVGQPENITCEVKYENRKAQKFNEKYEISGLAYWKRKAKLFDQEHMANKEFIDNMLNYNCDRFVSFGWKLRIFKYRNNITW